METLQLQPDTYAGVDNFVNSFFKKNPTDLTYEQTKYQTYYPVNAIGGNASQIVFVIPKWSGRVLLDLANAFMAVKIKIVTAQGGNPSEVVAPINNVAHSAFSELRVKYNNTLITPNISNYGYKKYLQALTSYNTESKNSALEAGGFYMDTPGEYNSISVQNEGFWNRLKRFCTVNEKTIVIPNTDNNSAGSGAVVGDGAADSTTTVASKPQTQTLVSYETSNWHGAWFISRLGTDIDDPVPSGIEVTLEFTLQDARFFLMTTSLNPHKFVIEAMQLLVPVRTLTVPVLERIEKRFKTSDMIQHFRRIEVRQFTIPGGSTQFLSDQLFPTQLQIPVRCIMTILPEQAYTGDFYKNPYQFPTSYRGNGK